MDQELLFFYIVKKIKNHDKKIIDTLSNNTLRT